MSAWCSSSVVTSRTPPMRRPSPAPDTSRTTRSPRGPRRAHALPTGTTMPTRTRCHRSISRRSTVGTPVSGVHRGPDREHPSLDLRQDHWQVRLASRGLRGCNAIPGPQLPVLDARAPIPRRARPSRSRAARSTPSDHPVQFGRQCLRPQSHDWIGFSRTGGSSINVGDDVYCRAFGEIQDEGSGDMDCTIDPNKFALPDPLKDLAEPTKPGLAPAMQFVGPGTEPSDQPEVVSWS